MATTRGTWQLDEAIRNHWIRNGLNEAFRDYWTDATQVKYEPLHDSVARPVPPGPYCVFEKGEPEVVARMTGSTEDKEIVRWPFSFTIHAKASADKTAKAILTELAKQIVAEFDPHNAIEINGSAHIVTKRGPDWHTREGDKETSWTLEYEWLVDAKIDVTQTDSTDGDSSVVPLPDEVDDVLDFADIGGVYDSSAAAVANTAALNTYIATRPDKAIALKFAGPTTYNDTKREPGDAYLDLSGGAISVTVGAAGNPTHLIFTGPSQIRGVNAAAATTPIFEITRGAGSMPEIVLRDMVLRSDGSVIKIINGGSGLTLDNVKIEDFTGVGTIDFENWTEIDAETFSYGIWIDNGDGARLDAVQIKQGSGHGIVTTRLNAGRINARLQHLEGAGFKLDQCNSTAGYLWAEHCEGYGLHVRDTGINRYAGSKIANDGSATEWQTWLEGNNGRSTPYNALGYSFSQAKFDNVARVRLTGHSGWRSNLIRLGRFDRVRNEFVEQRHTSVSETVDLELVANNTVSANFEAPDASNSNWTTVWTNASYRPSVTTVGTGGVDERIRITWPAGCFNNYASAVTAYWRMFSANALASPATFYFEAEVSDVDGAIAAYCIARENASNRQTPVCSGFSIDPVAGAPTNFALWDTNHRKFSGEIDIDDTRSDINPGINVWFPGMHDQEGNAAQDSIHVMDIHQFRLYRIT